MTVDLNLRTFSSGKKRKNNMFAKLLSQFIVFAAIAALTLVGAVPSFAAENMKAAEAPSVTGTSAILIDSGSGEILYQKNIDDKRDPASITKILNCLIVLETMEMSQKVTVPYDIEQVGHNIDLKKGEVLTVEQLLYAMMVYSANDAAEVLAVAAGGSVENFCDMMNKRAEMCGAEDTNFTNANGLNTWGQENHRTTAYDLALIAKEAMKNKTFRKLVSTVTYTIPKTNKSGERVLRSTNPCLYVKKKTIEIDGIERPYKYRGMTGIKTGSTGTAGECFCGSAKRGNTEFIAVVLNAEDEYERFADVIKLLDYGFDNYRTYTAASSREVLDAVKVKRGDKAEVDLSIDEDMDITLEKGYDKSDIIVKTALNKAKITAPVKKGTVLGAIEVCDKKGNVLAKAELRSIENVNKGGPLSYIGIADERIPLFVIGLAAALIVLAAVHIAIRRARYNRKMRRRAQRQRHIRKRERDKEKNPFDDFDI